MPFSKKIITSLFVTSLVACGGGGGSSDSPNQDNKDENKIEKPINDDKSDTGKPPADIVKGQFSPPDYQLIALTSENAETVVSEILVQLGSVIGDIAYILIDKYDIDKSVYTKETTANVTLDFSEENCKNGGTSTVTLKGDYISRPDTLSLYKSGFSSTSSRFECFAYLEEGFQYNYYNGSSTVVIEQGLAELSHIPYEVEWAEDLSKVKLKMDERIYVNSLNGSVITYLAGQMDYNLISDDRIGIKHSDFYIKTPTALHYLDKTNFYLHQIDAYTYEIAELSSSGFTMGAGSSEGLFSIDVTSPFEVSEFARRDLDSGSFTITSQQGVIKVELHESHYTYSLDAEDDGDFEITRTVNL